MSGSEKIKFLSVDEVRRLREFAEQRAIVDLAKGRRTGVVEWMALDLACLGLRASEIRFLNNGSVSLRGKATLAVRTLKRRTSVEDQLPLEGSIKKHLSDFLAWKRAAGESMDANAPLLMSNKGRGFSLRGIEHLMKRLIVGAGLDERFSCHSLRHTTAVHLLRKTKNLRLTQKVLRHASIATTTVYADVMEDDIREGLNGLYG